MLSQESRRLAGILLVVLPTVMYGGVSLLMWLTNPDSGYMGNPLRQNLFRAGHAHAGVLLVLSLVALRYVDEAQLSEGWGVLNACADPVAFRDDRAHGRSQLPEAPALERNLTHIRGAAL